MFDSAVNTIRTHIRSNRIDPIETEICGVPIKYENYKHERDTWDEWKPLLEEWLPKFDERNYIDGLNGIHIGDGYMNNSSSQGQYNHNDVIIMIQQNPTFKYPSSFISNTKEYVLLHETVHHTHINSMFDKPARDITVSELNNRQHELRFVSRMKDFDKYVSEYASMNYLEAVAETFSGVVLGNEYPSIIKEHYTELGGPTPIGGWNEEDSVEQSLTRRNINGVWKKETITYKSNAD